MGCDGPARPEWLFHAVASVPFLAEWENIETSVAAAERLGGLQFRLGARSVQSNSRRGDPGVRCHHCDSGHLGCQWESEVREIRSDGRSGTFRFFYSPHLPSWEEATASLPTQGVGCTGYLPAPC
jgi:hypothetical protein